MTGKSGKIVNEMENNSKQLDTVVLLDSISDLKNFPLNNNKQIITFDYKSHKILQKERIDHQTSDTYLESENISEIQKKSYVFSQWYSIPEISKYLEFEGVNTGKLFYVEFHYLLVPFLKKFFEIEKITTIHNGSNFLVSPSLYNITRLFSPNVTQLDKLKKDDLFLYDSIKYNLSNSISISISRKNYFKLKKLSDKLIHLIFHLKKQTKNSRTFLFTEFDPLKYESFFKILKNTTENFVLFNRRLPSIWNLRSFSILKKSHCKIATTYDVNDFNNENPVHDGIFTMKKLLDLLFNSNNLESFFSVNSVSFWSAIESLVKKLCYQRITEAVLEIELTKNLLKNYDFSGILIWNEAGFNEQIIIQVAKGFKIPIIMLQHGLPYETESALKYNKFVGIFPNQSDKLISWGNIFKNYVVDSGISQNKIEALGSIFSDTLFNRKSRQYNLKKDYILLATSSPVQNLATDLLVSVREKYEESIKEICRIAKKLNKKLVVKLHPFQEEYDISNLIESIDPEVTVIKRGNITRLIESCEVLVTMDLSTTILEAQILEKPTISISIKNYGFGDQKIFESNSCINTTTPSLESNLKKVLYDSKFQRDLINRGTNFINLYFSNPGNSSQAILSFLKNFKIEK